MTDRIDPQLAGPGGFPLHAGAFRYPDRAVLSAWTQHVPFMTWIVEEMRPGIFVELGTHNGMSYCAAAEAVKTADMVTKCYAVDTWKGDEHAGAYDEGVYVELAAYHDPRYAAFSRLVRSTFDEAAAHFSDGSVDLLHIDGLHTEDAVRHDFETWLPRLAQNAVVMFHDTNVRERGFGVYRLWEELAARHAGFEFLHGHGLGVLCVGEPQTPGLRALFDASGNDDRAAAVRSVFSFLGRAVQMQVDSVLAAKAAVPPPPDSGDQAREAELAGRIAERADDTDALIAMSFRRYRDGRTDEATEFALRALETDPQQAGLCAHCANLLRIREDWQAAVDLYRRALAVEPENGEWQRLLEDTERRLRPD